jgi:hypothetical protein
MSDRAAIVAYEGWVSADDLAHGSGWVRWLLRGVRARCDGVVFASREGAADAWDEFAERSFLPVIAPRLARAWEAALARDLTALLAADTALEKELDAAGAERSRRAGALLLAATRGARYQGILGHYRIEHEAGRAPGHFATVWAAVGNLFQFSLAAVLAEYLHLEWELAMRAQIPPGDGPAFTRLVSRALTGVERAQLRIVAG